MRFLCVLIIWHLTSAANNDSLKDYLDPTDAGDNAFLWKNLFIKLNTVLSETEKLSQGIIEVNKRLDDLTQRQNDHERRLTVLLDKINANQADNQIRLGRQESLLRKSFNHTSKWTTIIRRQDGSVDFNRNWNDYSNGFGNPDGEYFMGLQRIHEITTFGPPQELMIILKDFDGQQRYAKYDLFRIGSELEKYALLEIGGHSGDDGNDFQTHKGHKFTTPDQDNDDNPNRNNGVVFQGGWWFYGLGYYGYLNGPYRAQNQSNTWGISWNSFREWNHSLKYAEMMIRAKL